MAIATIQETIDRGNVSIYLSANDNSKGLLFGHRKASPISPVTIAMVTDALTWGRDGGAQTDEELRNMANYLVWLTGKYGQQAQAILDGEGGGTVVPSGGQSYPIYITEADFSTATLYPNTRIFGTTVIVYLNEINRYLIPGSEFTVTTAGIEITLAGFNAIDHGYTYNLVIERYY